MTLAPEAQTAVQNALAAVLRDAQAAVDAGDLASAKAALNAVWFSTHKAQDTINLADAETRLAALDKLNRARSFA